jgi:hypothetical protein
VENRRARRASIASRVSGASLGSCTGTGIDIDGVEGKLCTTGDVGSGRSASAEIDRLKARSASVLPRTLGGGGRWPPEVDARLGGS